MRARPFVLAAVGLSAIALAVSNCAKEPDADTSATASGSVTSDAEAAAAVRSQSARLVTVWPTENLDSIMPLFTEDAVLQFPEAPDARGQAAIRELLTNAFGMVAIESLETQVETIEVFGDVAYEWGTYRERYTEAGKPRMHAEGRYISRWERQNDGTWRITRFAGNTATEAPVPASGQ
jgi:uncharacterized protein (TIGR02246 family)